MDPFSPSEVEQLLAVTNHAADPTVNLDLADRKRRLASGVAKLIGADAWIWSASAVNHQIPGDFMTVCALDDGWTSQQERAAVYQAVTSPQLGRQVLAPVYHAIQTGEHGTHLACDLFPGDGWRQVSPFWNRTGFHDFIASLFPISKDFSSNVGFHRRIGRPAFTPRDRDLVHAVLGQVRWLHRHGSDSKADETLHRLTPRERQVLIFLLNGDTQKSIAEKLGISEYTVGDYMKQLNKRFTVNSRAELQARFFLGSIGGFASAVSESR
ncbi:MAG TPA: LuxR C-terminal-related transcriptional regulator [Lacipirellulaceae bacterium]|nr:LuxR C-terminal-related transcriptional regulator [Lacipirellulaceae bacterium]